MVTSWLCDAVEEPQQTTRGDSNGVVGGDSSGIVACSSSQRARALTCSAPQAVLGDEGGVVLDVTELDALHGRSRCCPAMSTAAT